MKRQRTSELKQPPVKLKVSPAQRHSLPTKKDELKKFILDASDELMSDANFEFKHLSKMLHFGTVEIVEKILKFHPELANQHGKEGSLPLMIVLRRKTGLNLNLIKKLLQYGANPFLAECKIQGGSLTPMKYVIENISKIDNPGGLFNKYVECRELFEAYEKTHGLQINHANIFELSQTFDQPPMLSIQDLNESELQSPSTELAEFPALEPIPRSGRIKELSKFISNASDETMQNSSFSVAHLFSMIHCGSTNAVEKILKFRPELSNKHGKSGKTPLMVVLSQSRAKNLNLKLIKKLLDYGADPFLRDIQHGKNDVPLTPMEFVVQQQRTKGSPKRQARYKECEALFNACEKKPEPQIEENTFNLNPTVDPQPMLEIEEFNESEWMQYLENLLDASELNLPVLDSLEQDQICNKNLEPEELNHPPTERWMEYLEDILYQPEIILPELALLEQSQVCEKNVEMDLFATSSFLQLSGNKTTKNKNELTSSTDFFESIKERQRFI